MIVQYLVLGSLMTVNGQMMDVCVVGGVSMTVYYSIAKLFFTEDNVYERWAWIGLSFMVVLLMCYWLLDVLLLML